MCWDPRENDFHMESVDKRSGVLIEDGPGSHPTFAICPQCDLQQKTLCFGFPLHKVGLTVVLCLNMLLKD